MITMVGMGSDTKVTAQTNVRIRSTVLFKFVRFFTSITLTALSFILVSADASASSPTVTTQQFGSTVLNSVGCLGDGTCIAFDSGVRGDIYEMSDGTWAQGPNLPNDQYGLQIWPEQISCSQDETCTIIGNDQQSIVSEVWQNGSWQTPVIADYQAPDNDSFHFQSISCYSVGNCLAVGWVPYLNLTKSFSIQEVNGVWQAPIADANLLEQYESVSCWSSSDCEVAGFVAQSLSGGSAGSTVWSVQGAQWGPPSTIYPSGWLTSISCPAGGACVAVGSSELTKDGAGAFPIESTLTSGTWSTPTEPDLENIDLGSWYTSVSCMDVGDCLAVGVTYGETDGFYSIFQNGQWATPVATSPAGSAGSVTSELYGSACSSNGFCVGTGMYGPAETVTSESCLAVMVAFRTQLADTLAPTVTGKPSIGNTLVADPGTWTGDPTFTYQWMLNGSPISGATLDSYEIAPQDVGANLAVVVTATDGSQSLSAESSNIEVTKRTLHPVLTLKYKAPLKIGSVVTARIADVPSDAVIHFKWLKNGRIIPHASQSFLKITSALSEHIIYFKVTISCAGYTTVSKGSGAFLA